MTLLPGFERPLQGHLMYGETTALCGTCLLPVSAKEVIAEGKVWLRKRCPKHGLQSVLLADDVEYFRRAREVYLKVGERVQAHNTPVRWGCPYDCGICPDHEQHGCLSLIEVTDACNLRCPTCYAGSAPGRKHHPLSVIIGMLDAVVSNEAEPDVVQLSGGEPTLHPEFWAIMDACRERPIRHLMVNTNGVRIARDEGFAEKLASYGPGLEVYLQFDSRQEASLRTLRGEDLRATRERALERLNALGLSTTLVVTVRKGLNDGELGELIDWAATQPCVRGVTVQPVQDAGRNDGFDPLTHRLTVSEVRRKIAEQSQHFIADDILPVPCHPDYLAMAYALKTEQGLMPVTRHIEPQLLVEGASNTISYERLVASAARRVLNDGASSAKATHQAFIAAFAANLSPQGAAERLQQLLCCLPAVSTPSDWGYEKVFRVVILQFMDRHSLDLQNVRRSCVHIAHPDGKRLIPFDTYNLFYRGQLEQDVLTPLRAKMQTLYDLPEKSCTASAS
jgi:7,8-dihydro-6-hydroxymethylpterin dimethyltransferase